MISYFYEYLVTNRPSFMRRERKGRGKNKVISRKKEGKIKGVIKEEKKGLSVNFRDNEFFESPSTLKIQNKKIIFCRWNWTRVRWFPLSLNTQKI